MNDNKLCSEERCLVCGFPLGGAGPQKGLCDPCMVKFRAGDLAPSGQRCALCGERRRRNLKKHDPTGEFVCRPCHDRLLTLPSWQQTNLRLVAANSERRLGPS